MTLYVYRRRDGSSFELTQRITDDTLVSCPTTGQSVERVMQPFTACYKGTGFYSTDHSPRRREPDRTSGSREATPVGDPPQQRAPTGTRGDESPVGA